MDAVGVGDRGADADVLGVGRAEGHVGHHIAAELFVGVPQAVETQRFRALDDGDAPGQRIGGYGSRAEAEVELDVGHAFLSGGVVVGRGCRITLC